MDKVWVYAESADGKATSATLEMVTKARELGSTVEALYTGPDADAVAAGVGEHGATKLFVLDTGDGLPGQVAAAAIAQLAGDHKPDAILFAQSYDGRDAIARLSVKLDRPVVTNGTSLAVDGDNVTVGPVQFRVRLDYVRQRDRAFTFNNFSRTLPTVACANSVPAKPSARNRSISR